MGEGNLLSTCVVVLGFAHYHNIIIQTTIIIHELLLRARLVHTDCINMSDTVIEGHTYHIAGNPKNIYRDGVKVLWCHSHLVVGF